MDTAKELATVLLNCADPKCSLCAGCLTQIRVLLGLDAFGWQSDPTGVMAVLLEARRVRKVAKRDRYRQQKRRRRRISEPEARRTPE